MDKRARSKGVQLPVPRGTVPGAVVKGMELIYKSSACCDNRAEVHWSAIPLSVIGDRMEELKSDSKTLSLWQDDSKVVVAWREESDV